MTPSPAHSLGRQLFAAVALGALTVVLVLPIVLGGAVLSGALGLFVLDHVGATGPDVDRWLAGVFAAMVVVSAGIASRCATPAATPARQPGWVGRHPWLSAGALLFGADLVIAPWASGTLPTLGTAVTLAFVLWVEVSLATLLVILARKATAVAWQTAVVSRLVSAALLCVALVGLGGWSLARTAVRPVLASAVEVLERAQRSRGAAGQPGPSGMGIHAPSTPAGLASFQRVPEGKDTLGVSGMSAAGASGSESALNACLEALRPELHRQALQLAAATVGDADAFDVVQDVLLKVCPFWGRLNHFDSYFIQSVKNRAGKWASKRRRQCELVDAPVPVCQVTAEDEAMSNEVQEELDQARCDLSKKDRLLLELSLDKHLQPKEIATYLGEDRDAVRQQIKRARDRLVKATRLRCGLSPPEENVAAPVTDE